ncbi:hydrolase [Ktedonobacter sp. SOSP1-52]|uniref:isochorismatase family protein n=1 Tax=Ktedonobacter sp. SOSP1-52 TaxID=2778366 RepID=UPI001916C84A|nr:isochorismatase family protein [Ktedonobacter sp. SOSP1-52]GHO72054.1 hydrolase [Ktedonobacter sp. SOSP1-52]
MTLTTIDKKAALIVVDLQKGVLNLPATHPVGQVVARSAELARAFRGREFPVVLVNVVGGAPGRTDASRAAQATGQSRPTPPPQWADLADELDPQPGDHRITKNTWGAFHDTPLRAHLQELGVTQVFLTGVATSIGVESTARSAHEHGYHVVLVTDAMTDRDAYAHQNSVERIFPRLGETATTEEVIAMLKENV